MAKEPPCSVFDLVRDRYVSLPDAGECVSDSSSPLWAHSTFGQELHQRVLEALDEGLVKWFEEKLRVVRPHALLLVFANIMHETPRGTWKAKHGTGPQILARMLIPGGGEWFRRWAQRHEPMFRAIDYAESNDGAVERLVRRALFRRGVPADVVDYIGTFVERAKPAMARRSVTHAQAIADPARRVAVAARGILTEEEFGAVADAFLKLCERVGGNVCNKLLPRAPTACT